MFNSFDIMKGIKQTYDNLNKVVEDLVSILTMSPESNSGIWGVIRNTFNILLPIGFSIATILLLITFINHAMLFKVRSYENVVKMFLLIAIGKVIIENSFDLLGWIYSEIANMMTNVGTNPAKIESLVDMSALEAKAAQMNGIEKLFVWLESLPITIMINLLNTLAKALAYGRLLEIYMYMTLAPLPLSTLVSEDYRHIGKSFFQSYIAVCLQGFIMLLSCIFYTGLAVQFKDTTQSGSLEFGLPGYLLASIVLIYVLTKSGSWAREMVGLR